LYLAVVFLKALFCEIGLFSGWKPKILDWATTTRFYIVSFLGELLSEIIFCSPGVFLGGG
jgi:hypothetical protein